MRTRDFCRNHSNVVLMFDFQAQNTGRPSILFFHNSIHRYFVFMPKIALTSIKQLFSLSRVDG